VVLVVVDGRQQASVGMSLAELASFFQQLGVVSAMNLDGGGSSAMVIKGQVVNHPSDGFERSVTNAIVLHGGG
jgi:exopolysaccharide biosynthesis protein